MDMNLLLENIIKKSSTLSPVVIIDESGIFEDFFVNMECVKYIENPSQIAMTMAVNERSVDCLFLRHSIDVSGFVASGKLKLLQITPEMLLNEIDAIRGKISGTIILHTEQYRIFVRSFDFIQKSLLSSDVINTKEVQNTILKYITGKRLTTKQLLLSVLSQKLTQKRLIEAELLQNFVSLVQDELDIPMHQFADYKDLLISAMITYSKIQYKEHGGAILTNWLINVDDGAIRRLAHFIMDNAEELTNELNNLEEVCKATEPQNITYALPELYVKYIGKYIEAFENIEVSLDELWNSDMKLVGHFVVDCQRLKQLLNNHVNYVSSMNTMDQLWSDYKNTLADIDFSFRMVESGYEQLAYLPDFYLYEGVHKVVNDLKNRYHNVIGNTNGRLLSYYDFFMTGRDKVKKQSEFFEKVDFLNRTVFIFADGFRYEMAKELKERFHGYEINDYDVIGELPSETEVGMNSYFIQDEKVRINDKNVFELVKDGKVVFKIYDWRLQNLSKKLGRNIVTFNEFMCQKDCCESVICFFDEADINMHHYDSASKMSEAITNLERIIRYCLNRKYDVMLLSDHGYVDVEKKLGLQDKNISAEKKKSRFLILNKNEPVETMYYLDSISGADFLELGEKKLCFINSTNSLRETSRYNHGGISLQENVITALHFHGAPKEVGSKVQIIFEALKAYNELTGKIRGAAGYTCNVLCGTDILHTITIEVEEYNLKVPVRNYEQGTEFLIMVSKGEITEKAIVSKTGNRVVDKDLDIFS